MIEEHYARTNNAGSIQFRHQLISSLQMNEIISIEC